LTLLPLVANDADRTFVGGKKSIGDNSLLVVAEFNFNIASLFVNNLPSDAIF
jgi:hypothetical protein